MNRRTPKDAAGFTLVEMLVTITIIGMLAAISMGGLSYARQAACEAATKATIAKLHNIIMEKYESYQTRRVAIITPVGAQTLTKSQQQLAEIRLAAIRYLMMMEMPERWSDVVNLDAGTPLAQPINLPYGRQFDWSSLAIAYGRQFKAAHDKYPNAVGQHSHAKCLYMIVAADPENMEQFSRSEIDIPDGDGLPVFIDGWGNPIYFLRWAPAFSNRPPYNAPSDVQSGDPQQDHDPFDTRRIDSLAFKLTPLIYSAGPNKQYGIATASKGADANQLQFAGNIFNNPGEYSIHGQPTNDDGPPGCHLDNIQNHHIESR